MTATERFCFAAFIVVSTSAGGCRSRPHVQARSQNGPTFRVDVEPALVRFCASTSGCHGEDPSHSVALDLRAGHAHAALVGAPATTRKGATRVVPGSLETSFLVDKLLGRLAFGEGKPMPLDPDTGAPPETNPLPAGFVEGVLKIWIARGAPED